MAEFRLFLLYSLVRSAGWIRTLEARINSRLFHHLSDHRYPSSVINGFSICGLAPDLICKFEAILKKFRCTNMPA